MTVETRRATVADAAAIRALSRDGLGYDQPLAATRDALEDALASGRELVVVATIDDEVVGYCHAEDYRLLYAPPMVNVLGIAVAKGARRRGVGSQLLEAVERWACGRGATAIRLVSGESRDDAHAFYARAGFRETKRQLTFRLPL